MNGIRFESVRKAYPGRPLFDGISFEVPSVGFYALYGPSGSGKSTILDLLTGLERPDGGSVYLLGRRVEGSYPDRLLDMGYLRQGYDLLLEDTALENAMLPLLAAGRSRIQARSRAKSLLRRLGLKGKEKRKASDLSGGEKARLSLARALALDPPVILADEPTGALDEANAIAVYALLREVSKTRLVFMVSHDEERTAPFLDGAYRLFEGVVAPLFHKEGGSGRETYRRSEKRRRGFSLFLSMAFRKMRAHRFESSFFLMILSFSLASLGTSAYLSESLPKAMASSFGAITGKGEIHLSSRDSAPSISAYAPDSERVREIASSLEEETILVGTSYQAAWESFFPERNEARLSFRNREWKVPGLSLRSLNEYCLYEEIAAPYYPEKPAVLEESQVVLGLPFEEMNGLAMAYGIGRNYESVGGFLAQNPFELIFFFENAGWGYDAELLLSVVAVVPTDKAALIHSSPTWSETIFEKQLRLPSFGEEGASGEPWALLKVSYLLPAVDVTSYVELAREEPSFDGYLLSRTTKELHSLSFNGGSLSSLNRLYLYALSGTILDEEALSEVTGRDEVKSCLCLAQGAYLSFPEAMASGFASPFFLSPSFDGAVSLAESLSSYDPRSGRPVPEGGDGYALGYYLVPRNQGLTLSSGGTLLEGRPPMSIDEVGLSSSLYERLGRPSKVYAAGSYGVEAVGDGLVKDAYAYAALNVTGIYEGKGDVMVVTPYWPIDFFRDRIGMSAFSLLPSQVILRVDEEESSALSSFLNARYPAFRFVDPSSLVDGGIAEAISYMEAVVSALVAFLGAMALLFTVSVALSGAERAKTESRSLYILGFSRDEVATRDFLSLALPLFLSLPLACLSVGMLEIVVHEALQSTFGSSDPFTVEGRPFLLVAAFAAAALFLLALAFFIKGRVRDFSRKGN